MNSSSVSQPIQQPAPGHPLSRDLFLVILRTALSIRETRFARQAALDWLIHYPGDLPVSLFYARALVGDGRPDQALPLLEELCQTDPEFVEAAGLLTRLRYERGQPAKHDSAASFSALGGKPQTSGKGPVEQTVAAWSRLLGQARAFLEKGDLERADQLLHQTLAAKPDNPLVATTHLQLLQAQAASKDAPPQALRSLAEFYHERWPGCLQCTLLLADSLMDGGEPEKAVALLHQAAASDVTGQVARRLWGEQHPYRALWPDELQILLEIPIPAGVAASLGWNRLPVGRGGEMHPAGMPGDDDLTTKTRRHEGARSLPNDDFSAAPPWFEEGEQQDDGAQSLEETQEIDLTRMGVRSEDGPQEDSSGGVIRRGFESAPDGDAGGMSAPAGGRGTPEHATPVTDRLGAVGGAPTRRSFESAPDGDAGETVRRSGGRGTPEPATPVKDRLGAEGGALRAEEGAPGAEGGAAGAEGGAQGPAWELPGEEQRPAPAYSPLPESLRSVQAELERVAGRINRPGLARSDGRMPVYVVMTTRRGLESCYGAEGAAQVEAGIKRLVGAVQERRDWRAMLFCADDGSCWRGKSTAFLTPPARPNDPWGLKLALADLDSTLKHNGEMIGAVLIAGGPEVVPFHHLPNPVDDTDEDVPSDNPYGTRDENYFIPEWPVGRLPGGKPPDAGPLLHALEALSARHTVQARRRRSSSWVRRFWERAAAWLRRYAPSLGRQRPSVGYTAAIWREASLSVFRPIGQPRAMLVSPPLQVAPVEEAAGAPAKGGRRRSSRDRKGVRRGRPLNGKAGSVIPAARLAYFNLHGLEDAVEWYGQRDPLDAEANPGDDEPDYPVALRPQDVPNHGSAPQVVFSEACYGAHILGKSIEQALALKFLESGSQAVVGSTCTAYGSVNEPLIAADFLGHAFWNYLRKGWPAGEALRRAKISLAQEMHKRQGYLDGEDQKTLISFVLYGDPLAQGLGRKLGSKSILRPVAPPAAVRTVCDKARREEKQEKREPVPPEVLDHVKQVVEQYLPGMAGASVTLSHEHADCEHSGHDCPTSQLHKRATPLHKPNRRLIILSKQVEGLSHLHRHYARVTLDEENKIVKLVVSR